MVLLLIKNPAGANEVLRDPARRGDDRRMMFALNDRIADGRDVSWVWDVDWELIAPRLRHVVAVGHAGGRRRPAAQVRGRRRRRDRGRARRRAGARPAGRAVGAGGAGYVLPTYTAMLELQRVVAEPRSRPALLGGGGRVKLVLCQLYPEHLSIYADRGNVQVIRRRLEWRGLELEERPLRIGEQLDPEAADLYLVGGGQDRDQLLVAEDLQRHRDALHAAVAGGAAVLAVCGGYQLAGHRYIGQDGDEMPRRRPARPRDARRGRRA